MADTLPNATGCCDTCDDQITTLVPGPAGGDGTNGTNGTNGVNAYTTLTAGFTMPAELANVTASVADSTWMVATQVLYIANAGYMEVQSKPTSTSVSLKNLEDAATGAYAGNAAPATAIANGSGVTPAGVQGPAGSLTGAAGGDLAGTYPNPTIGVMTTKGDVLTRNATVVARLAVGANGTRLRADSTQATGLGWATVDLSNATYTEVANVLARANGGLGTGAALNGLLIGDGTSAVTALEYIAGRATTALSNVNQTLTPGTSKAHQNYTGTLTGAVQITLSTAGAGEGMWYIINLAGVVTTGVNTLDIRDSGAGSLKLFNTANTVTGMIYAVYTGAQWELFNLSAVLLS